MPNVSHLLNPSHFFLKMWPWSSATTWVYSHSCHTSSIPAFGHKEGHKWFFQISSQWESQKNRFAFISFGKIQFLPPCNWDLPFMSYRMVWSMANRIQILKGILHYAIGNNGFIVVCRSLSRDQSCRLPKYLVSCKPYSIHSFYHPAMCIPLSSGSLPSSWVCNCWTFQLRGNSIPNSQVVPKLN